MTIQNSDCQNINLWKKHTWNSDLLKYPSVPHSYVSQELLFEIFNSGFVFRFSRTLHVLSELEQEKRTWRLIGSLYNDRQTSLDTIPTMDMETDIQVTQMVYNDSNSSHQCDIKIPTRWQLSMLLLTLPQ